MSEVITEYHPIVARGDDNRTVRERVVEGVNKLADTVKITLGTKGRLVMYCRFRDFEDPEGFPVLTKDGVTVATQIRSQDPIENMAIQVVRQAAQNTVESSGDGTTTTTILAQELITKGLLLKDQGLSHRDFSHQVDQAVEDITHYIENVVAKPIIDDQACQNIELVATISSNSEEVGKLIGDIAREVGVYADIEVKKSNNYVTEIETVKGMKLHRGYFAPFMCTDTENMEWRHSDVKVLVFDDVIRDISEIIPYIDAATTESGSPAPVLIYAQDIASTVINRVQNIMRYSSRPVMIVEHDGFGDRRIDLINDVAVLTGARIVDSKAKVRNYELVLGNCEEAIVNQQYTSIIGGNYNEEDLNAQMSHIKGKIESNVLSGSERKFYEKRLANLYGGLAVVYVGGNTRVEVDELYARIEDAVLAVKSSMRSGVVPGGAYTWENTAIQAYNPDKKSPGYDLVFESLRAILNQLLKNADMLEREGEIRVNILQGRGYNLITNSYDNIEDYKVLDPASVLIDSLVNAASVAKSLLSVERVLHRGKLYL